MKVRATKLGYYKGRRYPGDTFYVPDSWKAKWTEPADAPIAEQLVEEEPDTLGKVQRRNAKKDQKPAEEAQAE